MRMLKYCKGTEDTFEDFIEEYKEILIKFTFKCNIIQFTHNKCSKEY